MALESKQVLSSFTRKLANCRNSVSVKNLLSYFDEGKYGYTIADGVPTVITNDFAFADDIANLVTHIRAIFKKPRLFLKKENIIQNVSVATKMNVESMQDTYRDDKNWKMLDGEPEPEVVHTFTYEDNLAIYENKFICALIDAVYDIVSKKINQLCWAFETLNEQINFQKDTTFNSAEFLQFTAQQGEIPTLAVNNSPEVNVVGSLIKSKKRLQSLRAKDLYVQCKKAEKFSLKNVKSTNILAFDPEYNFCYNFYVNYLYKEPVLASPKQTYLNFVTVNLFRAITLCGYNLVDDETCISVSNSIKLRYEQVAFANDLFTLTVCPTEEGDLLLKVKANPDFNESTFLIHVVDKARVGEKNLFEDINDYAKTINAEKSAAITRAFLVSDYSPTKAVNAFYVEPAYADVVKRLQDLVRSCTMLAEGSFYIHSRICPVCGSNLVAPDGNDYICAYCESTYHIFSFGAKMYLWLKLLPDVESKPKIKRNGSTEKHAPVRVRLRIERTAEETEDDPLSVGDERDILPQDDTPMKEVGIDELPTPIEQTNDTEELEKDTKTQETNDVETVVEREENAIDDKAETIDPPVENAPQKDTTPPTVETAERIETVKTAADKEQHKKTMRVHVFMKPKTTHIGKTIVKVNKN